MNAIVPTNIQLPSHLAGRLSQPSAVAGAMTAGIGTSAGYKRISIRGGRFRVREGSQETVLPDHKLRCVIVGASPNMTKTFYKGAYNPKAEDKSPDCYSNDGIRPAKDASDPQSQLCATCEQNQWGSKMTETGARMKACADQKRLAVISADDDSPEPELYLFQVTPAALSEFRNYGNQLAAKGFPPELCVTEISFDPNEAYPKATFKFGGFVDEGMVATIDGLVGSAKVHEITGELPVTAEVVPATPKPSPIKVKAKEEYVPKVEVEDAVFEEEAVEAAPVKGFGSKAAPKPVQAPPPKAAPPVAQSSNLASDIQDILNGLGDDDE
jgi:hypothetical protein